MAPLQPPILEIAGMAVGIAAALVRESEIRLVGRVDLGERTRGGAFDSFVFLVPPDSHFD